MFKQEMLIRQSLHEQIAFRIAEMIVTGQLKVGDRLPSEPEMAKQFGVHRSTIREALRVLQQRGLVEMKVGSGSYVSQVSPSVVAETIDTFFYSSESSYEDLAILRTLLEPGIAALAALRAEREDLDRLEKAVRQMEAALIADDLDAQIAADAEFHLALVAASRNMLLFAIFSGIQYVVRRELKAHRVRTATVRRGAAEVLQNHQALFAAVQAGDPVRARELMNVQIRSLFEDVEGSESLLDILLER